MKVEDEKKNEFRNILRNELELDDRARKERSITPWIYKKAIQPRRLEDLWD